MWHCPFAVRGSVVPKRSCRAPKARCIVFKTNHLTSLYWYHEWGIDCLHLGIVLRSKLTEVVLGRHDVHVEDPTPLSNHIGYVESLVGTVT